MEAKPDFLAISLQVAQVFTPNTPVGEKEMFSGRFEQITQVVDVIFQKGQHAMIFGDRGVGKTSLANVLASLIPAPSNKSELLCVRINCETTDDLGSIWKKVFDNMELIVNNEAVGFRGDTYKTIISAETFLPKAGQVSTDDVRRALMTLSQSVLPIVIIDEFDRVSEPTKKAFADLIKNLSDHALSATVILLGVGDSVEAIIKEHESVARALAQINMPRMSLEEIKAVISNGLVKLGMTIEEDTLNNIAILSKGLPHYAHLIGKHAAREALNNESLSITNAHFRAAIDKAVTEAQHSIRTAYHTSIRSTKKMSLFSDVILACALASVNELGEFAAQDLKIPLNTITQKNYEIAAYVKHLDQFSSSTRENILIKTGARKRYRYKFRDPLMQSFVIMQGLSAGKITSPF